MSLDAWIAGHGRFDPDKPAIHFDDEDISYGALADRVSRTASVLAGSLDLKPGDRLAYYGMNHPDVFVLVIAAARLGLVVVPLNWRLAVAELRYIVGDCAPRAFFYGRHFAENVSEIVSDLSECSAVPVFQEPNARSLSDLRADVSDDQSDRAVTAPDDPLLIVYTSGTTGTPKGAVLSHQAVLCNAMMSRHAFDLTSQDVVLNVLPLFHVGGLNIQPLPALLHGATLVIHEKFEPDAVIDAIASHRVTLITSVPTVLQAMIDSPAWTPEALGSLRSIATGSTDVPLPLIEAVQKSGIPLIQVYGATETGPIAIYQRADRAMETAGSIGRCGLLCDVRLVGSDGKDVAPGENGEIWIQGDNILSEYWNNPDATRDNLIDGWFRTGDMARLDEAGEYWFADRIKHVIISGGENIYPAELERVLRTCPGLSEAAVVGRADAKWGMVPVVVAVKADDAVTRDGVLATFEERIARFKRPRDVVFVDALPRNALGKIVVEKVRALV
ncbi:MAG: AMP-binding protein [Pseudomonadota bacterium]